MLSDAIRGRVLNEVDMTLGQLADRVPLLGWRRPVHAGAGPLATPSSPNPDLAYCGWCLPSPGQPRWGGPFSKLPLCSPIWYTVGRGQANRDYRCR
jgi:hypothetical protein